MWLRSTLISLALLAILYFGLHWYFTVGTSYLGAFVLFCVLFFLVVTASAAFGLVRRMIGPRTRASTSTPASEP